MSSATNKTDFFFGFDLLYKTIEKSVTRKSDVLVALAHFVLMKHSSFRCLGVGEDKILLNAEIGSEFLPDGWNDNPQKYALRYKANNQLYLLLCYTNETSFILHLMDVNTNNVSNISLEPENLVKTTIGNVNVLMPCASQIADRMRKELIDPVYDVFTREMTTQTMPNNSERMGPLRVTDPMQPMPAPQPIGLPECGANDLDPLGRLGQGNLFPFPSSPRFGPPDRNVPQNPNPDHIHPPGFR